MRTYYFPTVIFLFWAFKSRNLFEFEISLLKTFPAVISLFPENEYISYGNSKYMQVRKISKYYVKIA